MISLAPTCHDAWVAGAAVEEEHSQEPSTKTADARRNASGRRRGSTEAPRRSVGFLCAAWVRVPRGWCVMATFLVLRGNALVRLFPTTACQLRSQSTTSIVSFSSTVSFGSIIKSRRRDSCDDVLSTLRRRSEPFGNARCSSWALDEGTFRQAARLQEQHLFSGI